MKTSFNSSFIVCNYGKIKLPFRDITHFKSEFGNYTKIFLQEREAVLTAFTLKHYQSLLAAHDSFFSPRKGVIVNKNYVANIANRNNGIYVFLKGGEEFKISRRREMEVMDYFN